MNQEELNQWLVELLDQAFLESDDNFGRPCTEQVANYLIKNGATIRERGEWLVHEGYAECGRCHAETIYAHNLCPYCGADMRGEKDE